MYTSYDKRMKEYELASKTRLTRRVPVILRIDGKAFHTFSKNFVKPFDKVLMKSMQETMKYLCENIQGCVFGYTQSDEITLVLIDYQKEDSSAYFDYEVQKLCSISASMATMAFNKFFMKNVHDFVVKYGYPNISVVKYEKLIETYNKAVNKGAMFDARCFNIPKEEVCNNIYWRQQDATRNSIQMVAHVNFTQKELDKKSSNEIQDMLFTQKGINWNDYSIPCKRGTSCIKKPIEVKPNVIRNKWFIDEEMPILKNENRDYIEKLINI